MAQPRIFLLIFVSVRVRDTLRIIFRLFFSFVLTWGWRSAPECVARIFLAWSTLEHQSRWANLAWIAGSFGALGGHLNDMAAAELK